MLWLTGLLGIVAVGAVSFLDLSGDDANEDEAETGFDDFIDENGFGDLSATLQALNALPAEVGAPDEGDFDAMTQAYNKQFETEEFAAQLESEIAMHETASETSDMASDWFAEGAQGDLISFDAGNEDLVLVWDDSAGEEPDVTLSLNDENPDLLDIRIGDSVMAQVQSLSLIHISEPTRPY